MAERKVIQTDEKLPIIQAIPLALQHLMAMFGATVLVPLLTGLDPSASRLMTSGVGTILYLICARNKIPSYLGSRFAFIGPIACGRRGTKGISCRTRRSGSRPASSTSSSPASSRASERAGSTRCCRRRSSARSSSSSASGFGRCGGRHGHQGSRGRLRN